jgi:exodeoxyribonuclease V alpha subunit
MNSSPDTGDLFADENDSAAVLTATISRVTYRSDSSGYTVARATNDVEDRPFTMVGRLPVLTLGERVRVTGQWVTHPRFGRQLEVDSFERLLPRTKEAIARYLGSGLIEGIGPKLAERLVNEFGEETLSVIEQSPQMLERVRGISAAKAGAIFEAVKRNSGLRDLTLLLEETGLGARFASRIFAAYGDSSITIVREDPYRLARDIWGIGFARADALARNLGVDAEDPRRVDAGVDAVLVRSTELGDVFFPEEELAQGAANLLGIDVSVAKEGVRRNVLRGKAIQEDERIYPCILHLAETSAAQLLRSLLKREGGDGLPFDDAGLEALQRERGLRLSEDQTAALELAHRSRIFVLTGGPGTGKTTLTRFLLDLLESHRLEVVLAAPTGRAARRLSEATGREACTIHRLLAFDPASGVFGRDEDNPIPAGVVLIDEASMMDLRLFESLLRALPGDARLILVGDANQLPSVGPGDVLRDLLRSRRLPLAELGRVFRQGERSGIVENAHRILAGESPRTHEVHGDFRFVERDTPEEIAAEVRRIVREELPRSEGVVPIRDVQVLAPMYKGETGVDALNALLQEDLNSGGSEVRSGSRAFRVGDRVIQLKNDYRKNVFNGEIGLVESISADEGILRVKFDSLVELPVSEWDQIALAYAITVHKSQGSEYEWVVIPLVTQHAMLLDRPLFYTAVTRARRGVILVGQSRALALALRPRRFRPRRSTLAERIRGDLSIGIMS